MNDVYYDIVIIGGGPGGYKCALKAAKLGFKTACIDKNDLIGGVCLREGCIPSKALLNSSYQYYKIKNNKIAGISANDIKFNLSEMMDFKNKSISDLSKGIEYLFNLSNITRIKGVATIESFESYNFSIKVTSNNQDTCFIKSKYIIIASGSEVISLPSITIDENNVISSTTALTLTEVPKKLVIVGGGVIGLEMASVWSRLGSEVTVVEFNNKIAPSMDGELSRTLLTSLKKQGINFMLEYKVTEIKHQQKPLAISMSSLATNTIQVIEADKVLVAIGRKPCVSKEIADVVKLNNRGFIEVDSNYETNVKGIFAIGDVIGGAMLAHKAEEEGVAVVEIIAGQHPHVDYNLIPSVIYTHPSVASIGKTEEQLKNMNYDYKIGKSNFAANGRSRVENDIEGFVKILSCKKYDTILGVHIIGAYADILINEAAVAMAYGASSEDIYRICHSHPDVNEALKDAAEAAFYKK